MEAAGGYEASLAAAILGAGLPLAVVNPKRIRDFAEAVGQTAKTDKIDARIIARFGAVLKPPVRETPDETISEIRASVVRKRQLTDMMVAEKNRTEHIPNNFIGQSIRDVIIVIETQITEIEDRITDLITNIPELKQKAQIADSVPGIGGNTAGALISGVPELGKLNRGQVGSLTGTAPMNRDSGKFRGKRMTGGGRSEIRTLMYMPTLSAIRHNPVIRQYYRRLISAGKNKMVAVVACMRKLLVIINSLIAKNELWNPNFA